MGINAFYVVLAVIFVIVLTFMFTYNIRLRGREKTLALKGRQPVSKEEGIAVATLEKERTGKPGSL
ncbi:MAG: hypothetical protein ABI286_05305 [Edaphobacter sp.]